MNNLHILDCTLRDGGYCNQWQFGYENIRKIVRGLTDANLDIIECGFLTNRVEYNRETTQFTNPSQIREVIPRNRSGKLFVAMINYGEFDLASLPDCNGTTVDGIRVAFHKKHMSQALEACQIIKDKGYKVFIQAMVSLQYSDAEFLELIRQVNELEPYAFYIVDSFGAMKGKELNRLFYMVENNLKSSIWIGLHSHNNSQLAFSNAQQFVSAQTNRNLIVDTSIYGMGRGAGNLNTELFISYLNDLFSTNYEIKPLLSIIDEILNNFYQKHHWGFSLPNYLSAKYNAHPNYADYFDSKKTLTVENMDTIFSMMEPERRMGYNKGYAEAIYSEYMRRGDADINFKELLGPVLQNKRVLLIAPGKSSLDEKKKISAFSGEPNVVSISVNHEYSIFKTDYIFLSNLRRFRELAPEAREYCILTSNIPTDECFAKVRYHDLLNSIEPVKDNAGLMAVKLCILCGAKEVVLAGFDGFSLDGQDNYGNKNMVGIVKESICNDTNNGMSRVLSLMKKEIPITMLTVPGYIKVK